MNPAQDNPARRLPMVPQRRAPREEQLSAAERAGLTGGIPLPRFRTVAPESVTRVRQPHDARSGGDAVSSATPAAAMSPAVGDQPCWQPQQYSGKTPTVPRQRTPHATDGSQGNGDNG